MTEVGISRSERDFANALKSAVVTNDVKTARRLIKGGVNVNKTYWYDGTLLHEAVLSGSREIIKLLISAGANVNAQNKDGRTALHLAARTGEKAIIEDLLQAEGDTNLLSSDKRSCLHVAIWKGHENVSHTLIEAGAKVNQADEDGWTPLFWAVNGNSLSLVRHLVDQGAQLTVTTKTLPFYNSTLVSPSKVDLELLSLLLKYLSNKFKADPDGAKQKDEVLAKIAALKTSVCSLAVCCRYIIRNCLLNVCQGQALSRSVSKLQIPENLQQFLMFEELNKLCSHS